ncbi:MAG: hypothetical protein ACQESR_23285 [Planctomycetota bacterium]
MVSSESRAALEASLSRYLCQQGVSGITDNRRLAVLVENAFNAVRRSSGGPPTLVLQWEFSELLPPSWRTANDDCPEWLKIVWPEIGPLKDKPDYISTVKLVDTIKKQGWVQDADDVLVVAHPDQLTLCLEIVWHFGFKPVAIRNISPASGAPWYDVQSGQIWTTDRLLYLIHRIVGTWNFLREHKLNEAAVKVWESQGPVIR